MTPEEESIQAAREAIDGMTVDQCNTLVNTLVTIEPLLTLGGVGYVPVEAIRGIVMNVAGDES